jgi:hypothetical protein
MLQASQASLAGKYRTIFIKLSLKIKTNFVQKQIPHPKASAPNPDRRTGWGRSNRVLWRANNREEYQSTLCLTSAHRNVEQLGSRDNTTGSARFKSPPDTDKPERGFLRFYTFPIPQIRRGLTSLWLFLFAAQPTEFFLDGLKKLEQRSHKCAELRGEYVNTFFQPHSLLFSL